MNNSEVSSGRLPSLSFAGPHQGILIGILRLTEHLFQLDQISIHLLVIEHLTQLIVLFELAGARLIVKPNVELEAVTPDLLLFLRSIGLPPLILNPLYCHLLTANVRLDPVVPDAHFRRWQLPFVTSLGHFSGLHLLFD